MIRPTVAGFFLAVVVACSGRSFDGGDETAGEGGEAGDPSGGGGTSGGGSSPGGTSGTGGSNGGSGPGGSAPTGGSSVGGSGPACRTSTDCPVVDLPCSPCPNGELACPSAECVGGNCLSRTPMCPGIDPCAGLPCGEPCNPCNGPDCPVTELPFTCNAEGSCTYERPACLGRCETWTDCPPPPPDCGTCTNGACVSVDCIQGACELTCDSRQRCTTVMDCEPTLLCRLCPDNSCAAHACIEERCDWACP